MRKIPTLFERQFENHTIVRVLPNVTPGMEWVLRGDGTATVKWDGACCAIINGEFYKRYDAKKGRKVPDGAIMCEPFPDPVTRHWPCWVKADRCKPEDKWFWAAYDNYSGDKADRTYEALGPHFRTNAYHLDQDIIRSHGTDIIEVDRSFDGIRDYLKDNYIEGIVFWKDNEPRCKIKRSDFGFGWGDR